ncbi:hypothetical protein [Mycobacteroides chelonae]|uniref:hypothetical protein n=1 Tax=Mycobacteroides chelonae TaxID=1774 RepID=UPI00099377C6|nr:hypothetical protein [Mycobacteroides chelonae]
MIEHYQAAVDLSVGIPAAWERWKMAIGITGMGAGFLTGAFHWKHGFGSVAGKVAGGIVYGVAALSAVGLLASAKKTTDGTGITTGNINFGGSAAYDTVPLDHGSSVDLSRGVAVIERVA